MSAVQTRRLAAIDIGTVTTRLLVADVSSDTIHEVSRSADITHLGEDLTSTGRLAPTAMERVREVIERYAAVGAECGVEEWTSVATSASRDAANSDEFLGMLEQTGIVPRIIDGTTEARLTFSGATFGTADDDVLVDDIGGGSTELVFGSSGTSLRIDSARSVDIGSRRLAELHLISDPPGAEEVSRLAEYATSQIRSYFDALERPVREVVSVAGTATSLVSVELALDPYDSARVHGHRLSLDSVRATRQRLAELTLEQRRQVVGLHPGRAPVIVAGALILEAILDAANVDSTLVSEHDILYGLLLDAYRDAAV